MPLIVTSPCRENVYGALQTRKKISTDESQSEVEAILNRFYTPVRSNEGVYSSFALLFCCMYPCASPLSMA